MQRTWRNEGVESGLNKSEILIEYALGVPSSLFNISNESAGESLIRVCVHENLKVLVLAEKKFRIHSYI